MRGRPRKVMDLLPRARAFLLGHGFKPWDEVAPAYCNGCASPVWVPATWPGDDWRVPSCPWCGVRPIKRATRPRVDCGSCQHYRAEPERDGKGWCKVRALPRLPNQLRWCPFWKPRK